MDWVNFRNLIFAAAGLFAGSVASIPDCRALRDCSELEYQTDIDKCEERNEAERRRQEQNQDREEKRNRAGEEAKNKVGRITRFRAIQNGYLSGVNGGSGIEVSTDTQLGLRDCDTMVSNSEKLPDLFAKTSPLKYFPDGITLADLKILGINVILSPQFDGNVFTDGSEEKSPLRQLQDYLAEKSDTPRWTLQWNSIVAIQSRYRKTQSKLSLPKAKIDKLVPRTEEELASYEAFLLPRRNFLGQYTGDEWADVDVQWANQFFAEQKTVYEGSGSDAAYGGRYRRDYSDGNYVCRNFKDQFVQPYEKPNGMDEKVRDYWLKLMRMTYYNNCLGRSKDDDIVRSRFAEAFRETVRGPIRNDTLLFGRMVMRQLNIALAGDAKRKAEILESLGTVGACIDAQADFINRIRPIHN